MFERQTTIAAKIDEPIPSVVQCMGGMPSLTNTSGEAVADPAACVILQFVAR
jgi:hypothetical protein